MISKYRLLLAPALILTLTVSAFAARRSLLEELSLPVYPDGKLATEIVLPAGPLLDTIAKEFAGLLGMSSIKQVNIVIYNISASTDTADVMKYYDPFIEKAKWTTLVRTVERDGEGTIILISDKEGMLVVNIDAPGGSERQINFVRAMGTIDRTKLSHLDGRAVRLGELMSESIKPGIPARQPISIPPSEKLDIQATKSDITARFSGQNTVEINPGFGVGEIGELTRTKDGRLLLVLIPKISIDEAILPGDTPVILELTDGSLTLSGGPGADEKPNRLTILSTGASVTLKSLPLVSGTHKIKVVGKSVDAALSDVQGGNLDVDVQGGDVTFAIPRTTSAILNVSAPSGKIHNLTGVEPESAGDDSVILKMGDGKAAINVKAVNGTVWIKLSR